MDSLAQTANSTSEVSVESQFKQAKYRKPTTFANFVAKALEDVRVQGIPKKPQNVVDSDNPFAVLRSYNLLGPTKEEGSSNGGKGDSGSTTEITFYTSRKGPGFSKEYESTSQYKDGKLVSCNAKKVRPSKEQSLSKSFTKMDIQTPWSLSSRSSTSSHSLFGNPRYYRRLKTLAELHEECEKRKIIERHNELTGRTSQQLPPISKWKYVEIESPQTAERSIRKKSDVLTCLPNDLRAMPTLKEENNMDEELERREFVDRIIVERRPREFSDKDKYRPPQEADVYTTESTSGEIKRSPFHEGSLIYNSKYSKDSDAEYEDAVEEIIVPRKAATEECSKKFQDVPSAENKGIILESRNQKQSSKIPVPNGRMKQTKGSEDSLLDDQELFYDFQNINVSRKTPQISQKPPGVIRSVYDFSKPRTKKQSTEANRNANFCRGHIPEIRKGVMRSCYDFY